MPSADADIEHLWRAATRLAVFTMAFNIAEGAVSILFGIADEGLTLFGFGMDSIIETVSAAGVLRMITRIRQGDGERSRFEITALRITGWCFHALAAVLLAGAAVSAFTGRAPESTLPGIAISVVSIASMSYLIAAKRRVGRALDSAPILADAQCTLVCVYMSMVLLIASALFALTGAAYIDALGAAALAYFSFREGREALEKARGIDACSCEAPATAGSAGSGGPPPA